MNEYTTHLSREGRIQIPAAVRRRLGFEPGEALAVSVVKGEIRVTRRLKAIRKIQKRLAPLRDPDNPAVDSLIRERRLEGENE